MAASVVSWGLVTVVALSAQRCWSDPVVFVCPVWEGPGVRCTWTPLRAVFVIDGFQRSGCVASCRGPSVAVGSDMEVRRCWSDAVARFAGVFGGLVDVGPCCAGRGPMSPAGRVYGWLLAWARAVVSWAGRVVFGDFGVLFTSPVAALLSAGRLCLVSFSQWRIRGDGGMAGGGSHPVGVCGACSSAGLFWPARLLSSRLGGGGLSAAAVAAWARWLAGAVVGSGVCPRSSLQLLGWAGPP